MNIDFNPTIFSIPLFTEKFTLDNEVIRTFCISRRNSDLGRCISNVGGWQSNDFNLNKPPKELEELVKCIFEFSHDICNFLEIERVASGHAWMNINDYGNFNWLHTHPGSALSGVYYVKTPNNCGNIQFQNPSMDMMIELNVRNYNVFNGSQVEIMSQEGMMCIFPSWLPHKVHPNLSNEERISISFNLK
jgi:uncharacterized protein (TIGR02466 family)